MKSSANLVEMFTSVQGEGLFIGNRQLFLRFAGCNLKCSYCDTKESWEIPAKFNLEQTPTKCDFIKIPNPVDADKLLELIKIHLKGNIHSVSLTGGEPLLHVEFLSEFLPILKNNNHKIFLETNGLLPDNLEKIINRIDFISMDIKLSSVCGHEIDYEKMGEFIRISYENISIGNFYVKVVVNESLSMDEFVKAVKIISGIDSDIPLVIQPLFRLCEEKNDEAIYLNGLKWILELQTEALKFLKKVLIIPQIHKLIGLK